MKSVWNSFPILINKNKNAENCSAEVKTVRCCAGVYPNSVVHNAT